MSDFAQTVRRVLGGDLSVVEEAKKANSALLRRITEEPGMRLPASAVQKVLESLASGADPLAVSRWANFSRHFEGEPGKEEATANAIARLTELGDAVDGRITPEESARLIASLGGHAAMSLEPPEAPEFTYGTEPPGPGWEYAGEMKWVRRSRVPAQPAPEGGKPRIAVVGGGPAGMFTTYILNQKLPQAHVTIFEASGKLGGKIRTDHFSDGTPFEAGVAELYEYLGPEGDPLRQLIEDDLGLPTKDMQGGAVHLNGKLVRDPKEIEKEFGYATRRRIEAFHKKMAELMPLEKYACRWQPDNEHPWADKTFRDCILEELGDDADARAYVESAVHSDLATEPWTCNGLNGIKNVLLDNADYMTLYHVVGGIGRVPEELEKKLRAEVRFNTRILQVDRKRRSYRVAVQDGGWEEFDAVILAMPNHWLSEVGVPDGLLRDALHRILSHYDLPAHYLRVSFLYRSRWWAKHEIPGDFWMMDAFHGCCQRGAAPVRMGDGSEKAIQDVKRGDQVVTHTGCSRTVLDLFRRQFSGDMVTLHVQGHPFPLEVTEDHPVAVMRDRLEWVPAGMVVEGDSLVIGWDRRNPVFQTLDMADLLARRDSPFPAFVQTVRGNRWNAGRVRLPRTHERNAILRHIAVTPSMARLMGLYLAEGGCDENRVSFSFHAKERDTLAAETLTLMRGIFGAHGAVQSMPNRPNSCVVRFANKNLREVFKILVPGDVYTKRVPGLFFRADWATKISLILGWLHGDGHVRVQREKDGRHNTTISGVSVSSGLARDMAVLALSCGMRATVQKREATEGHREAYAVYLYGDIARSLFPALVEELDGVRKAHMRDDNRCPFGYSRPVKKVVREAVVALPVFDMEVGEDHSYLSGDLAVHNCAYDESFRWGSTGGHVLSFLLAGQDALTMVSHNQGDAEIARRVLQSLPDDWKTDSAENLVESRVERYVGSLNAMPGGWPAPDVEKLHQPEPTENPGVFLVGDFLFDSTLNACLISANTAVARLVDYFGKKAAVGTEAVESLTPKDGEL